MDQGQKAIVLNAKDNVATALMDLEADTALDLDMGGRPLRVRLTRTVPFGHKFSLAEIRAGEQVIKYGEVIGTATEPIHPGDYVHIHNVASTRGRSDRAGGAA
jgi:altronate dehydratase small subunit